MITLNYTLGVYPAYNGTVAKLSQYSNDFTLIFTLTNDYGDFVLEDGTTAQIRGTKADGNGYSANCTIDIEAQTVTVTGDEQITAAAGDNTFEIRLIKDEKILNTVNFTIWVERAALDAGTITSDSVLLELNAIIEGAQTATEAAASASASAAEAATSAATLRLDPTLTQSGESADAKVVGDALASGLAARYNSASPYAVGDYMLKDNVLYHVTRAIPAGGDVTVGTNVEIAPLGNTVTALNSNMTYKVGDSVQVETTFTGKATNAKDGYFGAIILPKAVKSGLTITISNASQYGYWYSDGASHTLSFNSITNIAAKVNALWFKIPATNISDAASLAWLRFAATITFS
jgi:hypothetical protein